MTWTNSNMARHNANEHLELQHVADKQFRTVYADHIMGMLESVARVRDMVDPDQPGTEDFFTEQISQLSELYTECLSAESVVQKVCDLILRVCLNMSGPMRAIGYVQVRQNTTHSLLFRNLRPICKRICKLVRGWICLPLLRMKWHSHMNIINSKACHKKQKSGDIGVRKRIKLYQKIWRMMSSRLKVELSFEMRAVCCHRSPSLTWSSLLKTLTSTYGRERQSSSTSVHKTVVR